MPLSPPHPGYFHFWFGAHSLQGVNAKHNEKCGIQHDLSVCFKVMLVRKQYRTPYVATMSDANLPTCPICYRLYLVFVIRSDMCCQCLAEVKTKIANFHRKLPTSRPNVEHLEARRGHNTKINTAHAKNMKIRKQQFPTPEWHNKGVKFVMHLTSGKTNVPHARQPYVQG